VGAVVVLVLVVLAFPLFRPSSGAPGGSGPRVGQAAPPFVSTDLTGQPVDLAAFRGHPVVLNFWASWCIPCRAEFPVLKALLQRHPEVVVLGVVFQDPDASAGGFMRAQAATWPGVRDPKAQIADAYDVHAKPGIPVSILIDAMGTIRARQYGGLADQGAADAFLRPVGAAVAA
jgi:cytochrome c biogenesis protein CcmG/thiol:disulfide interchange protein DsbE